MVITKNVQKNRNKVVISISVDPYHIDRAKRLVEQDLFGSVSSLVTIALQEFLSKYDEHLSTPEIRKEELADALASYIHTDEGRSFIKSICEEDDPVVAEIIEEEILQ